MPLSAVIVKVHVVFAHAVALPVPPEKTPGGVVPAGAFATIVTTDPLVKVTGHEVDGLLHSTADGMKGEIDIASGMIGRLDAARLRDVIKAIGDVLDSDCEPN